MNKILYPDGSPVPPEEKGWAMLERVEDGRKILNVVPFNDDHQHIYTKACECGPSVEEINGHILIGHNAYDCREYVEQAEKIKKKTEANIRRNLKRRKKKK